MTVKRPDPASLPSLDLRELDNPIRRFQLWWSDVHDGVAQEPAAMVVASVDERGRPSARVVLLRAFDERGFVFYTNLGSRKGRELLAQPHAALNFFWEPLHRQVRVEGTVTQVRDEEADAYFASRPRESQLSAWASQQSQPLPDEDELWGRFAELEERFAGAAVPRPPRWSGLRVAPDRIEFWQEGPFRRHRRDEYQLRDGRWVRQMLQP